MANVVRHERAEALADAQNAARPLILTNLRCFGETIVDVEHASTGERSLTIRIMSRKRTAAVLLTPQNAAELIASIAKHDATNADLVPEIYWAPFDVMWPNAEKLHDNP